jgi:signal transduction histidine kinase
MLLVGVLSWRAVSALYESTMRENLLAQAQLAAAALHGQVPEVASSEAYSQASNVQPGIHTRVLGEQGAVVIGLSASEGDGLVQVPPADTTSLITPDELLERPEIKQALQGLPATAIRRVSDAENRRVLYAAAPILGDDATVFGLVYLAMPLPPVGLPDGLVISLASAALTAIVLAALTGSLLARRIARPVETIEHAAAAVSAGDLQQQVLEVGSIRELNGLARAFNQMTESLRQSELAKDSFVADVTHELRTPLTVIKGTIETLEDGALADTAGRGLLLASMHRETDRLIRLVNGLLVLIRADAGTLNLSLRPFDLAKMARARCEQLAPLAARRSVHLVVNVEPSPDDACAMGDPDRVAQVLDNLLDNAIRYSPEGSTVEIGICRQGNECECAVHDRGPGIPTEHLTRVFERFYRVDASRNRQSGGAGLGLAIARALIESQGGRITAGGRAGKGTTVRFTLPAKEDCHAIGRELTPS